MAHKVNGGLREKFQGSNHLVTGQRRAIFRALEALDGRHPSAEEVYLEVKRVHPRIALGTVYVALSVLEEIGIIEAKHWAGTPTRYDLNTDPHYDILCTACGKVEEIPDVEFVDFRSRLQNRTPYKVTNTTLAIDGVCPECSVGRTSRKDNPEERLHAPGPEQTARRSLTGPQPK